MRSEDALSDTPSLLRLERIEGHLIRLTERVDGNVSRINGFENRLGVVEENIKRLEVLYDLTCRIEAVVVSMRRMMVGIIPFLTVVSLVLAIIVAWSKL